VVLGLEPRDVDRPLVRRDGAKPHECVNLVNLALHGVAHRAGANDVRVARDAHEPRLVPEAPQQPVQQREACGIAVKQRALGERHERTWNFDCAIRSLDLGCQRGFAEQARRRSHDPFDVGR
jgi:hypothetical protein